MRLNKATQYALLLAMYLNRAGRARLEDVAANLKLSKNFLEQVARKLKQAGAIRSIRGQGGGYEIHEAVTVSDILSAMGVQPLLTAEESEALATGATEQRALANFVGAVSFSMSTLLDTKISDVNEALVQQEMEQLDSLSANATAN